MDITGIAKTIDTVRESAPTRKPATIAKLLDGLNTDVLTPLRDAVDDLDSALTEAEEQASELGDAEPADREDAHENLVNALGTLRDELVGIGLIAVDDHPQH